MKKDNLTQIEKFYAAVREMNLDDDGAAVDRFLHGIANQRNKNVSRNKQPLAPREGE